MAMTVCPKCGELCHDYDIFCPACGALCSRHATMECDGKCSGCIYDMPHGCTKPTVNTPFVSPYPHSIVEKKGKLFMVEESDKRSRLGTIVLALLPTGALGIHDFYARYNLRGLAHLALIIAFAIAARCSNIPVGAAGFWLSWGLSAVEAALIIARKIKKDGKGFPFA